MIETFQSVLRILEIIIGVGLIIFVHELGHFLLAKRNKVKVEIFSIGFGPCIFKWIKNQTEYRISLIPLGGYVKMAGELFVKKELLKGHELCAKSPWQRFQILVAGALMNIALAFPLCMLCFMLGKYVTGATVSAISVPEAYNGMKPADKIIEIDGKKIMSLEDYRRQILRGPKNSLADVKVLRDGRQIKLKIPRMGSQFHRFLPIANVVAQVKEDGIAFKKGIKKGDRIIKINNVRILNHLDLINALKGSYDKEVEFVLKDRDERIKSVKIKLPSKRFYEIPEDLNLIKPIVASTSKGYPAHEILKPGDLIIEVAGKRIKSWQELKEIIEPNPCKELSFTIARDKNTFFVTIKPVYNNSGKGAIGIRFKPTNVIADVKEGSYYYKMGLQPGDILKQVDKKEVKISVLDLFKTYETPQTVKIIIDRGGKIINLELKTIPKRYADIDKLGIALSQDMVHKRWGLFDALGKSIEEIIDLATLIFQLLYKLIIAEESIKGLAGPVGIFQVSYISAQLGLGNLLWLLALITINLGIINLFPLPLLDGGHIVLLVYEKLRGKAPSERFIAIYQYIGLCLLLMLIIFITYNDIIRLFKGW